MTTSGSSDAVAPSTGPLVVLAQGRRREVTPDRALSFGRALSCGIVLDQDDTAISRTAGTLLSEAGTWWVRNDSSVRALGVIDALGLRSVLPPGRRTALETTTSITVEGSRRMHVLELRPPAPAVSDPSTTPPASAPEGLATRIGADVLVSAADRLALVALFAGYLEDPPRHDPNPRSYAAAATRLGCPRSTLVKRVEYLRTRLTAAGVPGLSGWTALWALAEWALTTGTISKQDLALLPGR